MENGIPIGHKLYNGNYPREVVTNVLAMLKLQERKKIMFTTDGRIPNPALIPCYVESVQWNINEGNVTELKCCLNAAIAAQCRLPPSLYTRLPTKHWTSPKLLELALRYSGFCGDAQIRPMLFQMIPNQRPKTKADCKKWEPFFNILRKVIAGSGRDEASEMLKYQPVAWFIKTDDPICHTLREASKAGNLPVVNLLLEDERIGPSCAGLSIGYALSEAVRKGRTEVAKRLLKEPPNNSACRGFISDDDIIEAAEKNCFNVINILEERRIIVLDDKPKPYFNTMIGWAAAYGHIQIVKKILTAYRRHSFMAHQYLEASYEACVRDLLRRHRDGGLSERQCTGLTEGYRLREEISDLFEGAAQAAEERDKLRERSNCVNR